MGLTNQVREFFTNRINTLLDEKMRQVMQSVNVKKVKDIAVQRFCDDWGLSQEDIKRWKQIQVEQKSLEDEEDKIQKEIYHAIEKSTNGHNRYYCGNCVDGVVDVAYGQYKDTIIEELYPEVPPKVAKIQKIKDDVQSVVLLATTETKLLQRLTSVLQKYGGDMSELLEYIPDKDY